MSNDTTKLDEQQRRLTQQYIFSLEEMQEKAEELVRERTAELNLANQKLTEEIRERREAENTLRAMEAQKSSILDAIPHAVLGLRERVITFANDSTAAIFGWQPEELIGQSSRMLYRTQEEFENLGAFFAQALRVQRTSSRENICRRKDGSDFDCRLSASRPPTDPDGREIVIVIEDITERKKIQEERTLLQAQLLQSQKMEAIGTLAGGIAHDFNNILMGIQGYVSLMLHDREATPGHRKKLSKIEEMVQSAAELTGQLLGFARGGKYDVKPLSLCEILTKTSSMFQRTRQEIVILRTPPAQPVLVEADQTQLEQVFLNIFVNADHAMPGGGILTLNCGQAEFSTPEATRLGLKPGRYVYAAVTDNGIGMDEETRKRVFEPFFTTKEMGRGTGLGLASAYGIICNHGGTIDVQSNEGEGSTFTVYLPASQREAPTVAATGEKLSPLARGAETILLVDDNPAVLEIGEEMLRLLGYSVLCAPNGSGAVSIYQRDQERIDMVILDLIMPGQSGYDTYVALKRIDPGVMVLLSSGYSVDGQASELLEQGCNGFLQKPFAVRELSQAVRSILDGRH